MDALIARIQTRIADPQQAVDAAAWVHPMPTVRPRVTLAEVEAAEKMAEQVSNSLLVTSSYLLQWCHAASLTSVSPSGC